MARQRVWRSTNSVGRQVALMYWRLNSANASCWSSRLGLGRVDPVGDFGRSGLGVIHAGEIRHRLGTLVATANRHMGGLVGAENGERMLQRFELAAEIVEFLRRTWQTPVLPDLSFTARRDGQE
jgi:hypothetical protein